MVMFCFHCLVASRSLHAVTGWADYVIDTRCRTTPEYDVQTTSNTHLSEKLPLFHGESPQQFPVLMQRADVASAGHITRVTLSGVLEYNLVTVAVCPQAMEWLQIVACRQWRGPRKLTCQVNSRQCYCNRRVSLLTWVYLTVLHICISHIHYKIRRGA
jgi:hypothetical protein